VASRGRWGSRLPPFRGGREGAVAPSPLFPRSRLPAGPELAREAEGA
jgi:hypothetical protein